MKNRNVKPVSKKTEQIRREFKAIRETFLDEYVAKQIARQEVEEALSNVKWTVVKNSKGIAG